MLMIGMMMMMIKVATKTVVGWGRRERSAFTKLANSRECSDYHIKRIKFWFVRRIVRRSSGRAVYCVGLRPLACWGCGLESHRLHGCRLLKESVLLGRGLCDELITRTEESYRLWYVFVCDQENFMNEEALALWGAVAPQKTHCTFFF
jgi:hypothetical protein